MFRAVAYLLFLTGIQLVAAQFQFFDGMFQQQHRQQQQPSGASQWAAHLESVSCPKYLCPATLDCVPSPIDCPCPNAEDIKCTIPDGENKHAATVICVRGGTDCSQLDKLTRSR